MKRILLPLVCALILSSGAFAQTTTQEAKALLNKASEKMRSFDNLYLTFTYFFENSRVEPPVTQQEKGQIAIKGDTYRLKFMGTEQIRNANKLYTILEMDEEVQVTQYEEGEETGLTPTRLLNLYQKGYSYKLGGTEKKDGKVIQYVILKPNASEEVDKIMVGIEKDTHYIHSLKQWGTNGTVTTFQITSFEPNKKLAPGYFTFKKENYPGYYIAE